MLGGPRYSILHLAPTCRPLTDITGLIYCAYIWCINTIPINSQYPGLPSAWVLGKGLLFGFEVLRPGGGVFVEACRDLEAKGARTVFLYQAIVGSLEPQPPMYRSPLFSEIQGIKSFRFPNSL